jgi:hypothetical protein
MLALVASTALGGCKTMADPQTASVTSQPTTPVVKNITSFTDALRCMDDLFLAYGKHGIVITSDGLPDQTGAVAAGTKEMMISAISKMTTKSQAFQFVDVERSGEAVFWFNQTYARDQLSVPKFYIRGAITQVDQAVLNDSQSAGVALPFFSLGYSQDQLVSLVSMDLNMGRTETLQILSGVSSTNTIAVVKSGRGGDAEGLIQKASLFLEVAADRAQGTHASVRTLVELGLIELLGKFTRVPYWRCLEIDSTNPEMMAQARDWYDSMSDSDRVHMTQAALHRIGYYDGPKDGVMNRSLMDGINRYKAERDLLANGRIDFDLYSRFIADDLASGGKIETALVLANKPLRPVSPDDEAAGFDPLGLRVTPNRPYERGYRAGETVSFTVSVEQPSDVYCYYEAGDGSVLRIYPNRFEPTARLLPGSRLEIPTNGRFSILLDKPGVQEHIACIATRATYTASKRPAVLSEPDLQPLKVTSLGSVIYQHQGADRMQTSVRTLTIAVQ